MIVIIAPCSLHHPPKPLYAGHSPAQLVSIANYDPMTDPENFARKVRLALADTRFSCSVVVLRITVDPRTAICNQHLATLVRAVRKRNTYGTTQKVLFQRATPTRRHACTILSGSTDCFPWDTAWKTRVPPSALRLKK